MSFIPSLATLTRSLGFLSVLTVSSVAGLLYTYQTKLIYPSNLPGGAREDQTRPSRYGLPFEEMWLKTPDGEKLHAWYIRAEAQQQRNPITLVMFQANAGNIAHRLPLAAIFYNQLRCNVIMLSYRGYGLSTGQPNEKGIKIDAQVLLDWVKANLSSSQKIVLYGQSLGGAVAIDAAVRNASWTSALILENTFLDIPALIPTVLPPAKYFSFLCREIWSSRTRLPLLDPTKVKVLFLSGREDELVPPSHMTQLYGVCKAKVKEWMEFKEGTHNDTCMKPGYFPSIASFLHRHFGHQTPFSREALSRGYSGGKGPSSDAGLTEGEKDIARQLDDEEGYSDGEKDTASAAAGAAKEEGAGAADAGLRRRGAGGLGGAGSVAPEDIMEEIETEGVQHAKKLAKDDKGSRL
ncbi:unnamed protein product [Jaminaea pallidilutea]